MTEQQDLPNISRCKQRRSHYEHEKEKCNCLLKTSMYLFRSPFHPPTTISVVSFRASRKPHFLRFNYLSSETSTIYTVHALLALLENVRGDRRVFRLSPGSDGRGRKSTSGRRKNGKRFPTSAFAEGPLTRRRSRRPGAGFASGARVGRPRALLTARALPCRACPR